MYYSPFCKTNVVERFGHEQPEGCQYNAGYLTHYEALDLIADGKRFNYEQKRPRQL